MIKGGATALTYINENWLPWQEIWHMARLPLNGSGYSGISIAGRSDSDGAQRGQLNQLVKLGGRPGTVRTWSRTTAT